MINHNCIVIVSKSIVSKRIKNTSMRSPLQNIHKTVDSLKFVSVKVKPLFFLFCTQLEQTETSKFCNAIYFDGIESIISSDISLFDWDIPDGYNPTKYANKSGSNGIVGELRQFMCCIREKRF